jgi:hypothetical protein
VSFSEKVDKQKCRGLGRAPGIVTIGAAARERRIMAFSNFPRRL